MSLDFKPTSTRTGTFAQFLTKSNTGMKLEFFLSRGRWRISLFGAPSKLLLVCTSLVMMVDLTFMFMVSVGNTE
jgi:hypothetical protein